jgi:hypothetical protein
MSATSPTLQKNATGGNGTAKAVPPTANGNGNANANGSISSFFKKPGTSASAAAAGKPSGKAKAVARPSVPQRPSGAAMPGDSQLFCKAPPFEPPMLDKLFLRTDDATQVLTSDIRNAQTKILPVVLNIDGDDEPGWKDHVALLLKQDDRIFIVTEAPAQTRNHATAAVVVSKPMSSDETACAFSRMRAWSPGHAAAANPQIASILWRAKAEFKRFDWEVCNTHDISSLLAAADKHHDVVSVPLPPAPAHVRLDFDQLTIDNADDKEALKKAASTWSDKAVHWTPPEGGTPSHPIRPHDPRATELGCRADLLRAVTTTVRAPNLSDVKAAFPGNALADGIVALCAASKPSSNGKSVASAPADDDDDEEESATRALFAPPKPPPAKPKKGGKGKGSMMDPASFVHGARGIRDGDEHDSGSDEDDEYGEEEEEEAEKGFIASDDDVDEAGSTASAEEARAKRLSNKRKERWERNVISPIIEDEEARKATGKGKKDKKAKKAKLVESDSESGSDDDEDDDDSSSGDEESGSGSNSGSSSEDDDEDDEIVKHKKDASDAEDVHTDDDDDIVETNKAVKAASSRLTKLSDLGKKKKADAPPAAVAQPPSKKSKPAPPAAAAPARPSLAKGLAARQAFHEADPDARAAAPAAKESTGGERDRAQQRGKRVGFCTDFDEMHKRATALLDSERSILHLPGNGGINLDRAFKDAKGAMHQLPDNNYIANWHEVTRTLLEVTSTVLKVVEVADASNEQRKKHDNANAELGAVTTHALQRVVPQIEELQKTISLASTQMNTLVGAGAGMAARIAAAVAKKATSEGK